MTTLAEHPLLAEFTATVGGREPDPGVLRELKQLAYSADSLPARTRVFFQRLRKVLGRPRAVEMLYGVQYLAQQNHPAGARLLASLLDANTSGSRLLPRINSFASTRRLQAQMESQEPGNSFMRRWEGRLQDLRRTCQELETEIPESRLTSISLAEEGPQFLLLRRVLNHLVATLFSHGDLAEADSSLLSDLAALEVDAYQERVSQLAGKVDPYRTTTVARVLPLLSQADSEIRDLREFITWIGDGQVEMAFHHRVPRSNEVFDPEDRVLYSRQLSQTPELGPLAALQVGLQTNAIPVTQMADIVARLIALGHQLVKAGVRKTEINLIAAARISQIYDRDGELRLPLVGDLEPVLTDILCKPEVDDSLISEWPMDGFAVDEQTLVLCSPRSGSGRRIWRDDLPAVPPDDEQAKSALAHMEDIENPKSDEGISAIKNIVVSNLGSVSMVTGFLRNPKITAIPGLVATITNRTRSLQVLSFIASNRALYSGFANKDVPRLLLSSPCNIPVKTLRRFVHVKYVSKVDLKRMAQDKSGIRKEVITEIEAYFRSLT